MQHNKWLVALFLSASVLLSGCLKDNETFTPSEEYIETSAFGVVLDDLNLPVENATVAYEGGITMTDSNGIFIFSDVVVPTSEGMLEVTKEGFFQTIQSLNPTADNRSLNVHIQPLGQDYVFPSQASRVITAEDDVRLDIPVDAFSNNDGSAYSGQVVLNIGYVDPLDLDATQKIPGGHIGENFDNEKVYLEHYGTVYTSYISESGEMLDVADQKDITIHFPIPAELKGNAPFEMPLWYLDPISGQWMEDGLAAISGDSYVALVDKQGTYSIQQAFAFAKISGRVKTKSNQPVERARVSIARENSPIKLRVWTNEDGKFTAYYPTAEHLVIEVEDECANLIYSSTQGPFLGNYELSSFEVDEGKNYFKLNGIIIECNTVSTGVNNGYALLESENYVWITPANSGGAFKSGLFNCGSKFTISVFDITNGSGSKAVVINDFKQQDQSEIRLGIIEACR